MADDKIPSAATRLAGESSRVISDVRRNIAEHRRNLLAERARLGEQINRFDGDLRQLEESDASLTALANHIDGIGKLAGED